MTQDLISTAAIIGAGIAGLTAALCLARKGVHCTIFEQSDVLSEVGAGLQLSPNGTRILRELGVLPALEAVWNEPDHIALVSGRSCAPITRIAVGSYARERWGAPYGVLLRSTLQGALLKAVEANPLCRLQCGVRVETLDAADLARLLGYHPDLVVAADGVWSKLRRETACADEARFSGQVAVRFMVDPAELPGSAIARNVTAFVAPGAHLVAYPLKETGRVNMVAIVSGMASERSWAGHAQGADRKMLNAAFDSWQPQLRRLVDNAQSAMIWPLYEMAHSEWSDGNSMALIGDAAHAMTPYAAQGATMAIEDAYVLADCVGREPLKQALATYASLRNGRVNRVRKRAAFNRFVYHTAPPISWARDLVLKLRSPKSLARDFDWLYGYKLAD